LRPGYAIQVPGVLCEHIDRKNCLHALKYDDVYEEFFWNYGSFEYVARNKMTWEKYPSRVNDLTPDPLKVDTDPNYLKIRYSKWMGEANSRILHKMGMYSGDPMKLTPEEFNYAPETLQGMQLMINKIGQRVPVELWGDLGIQEYVEPHPFWSEIKEEEGNNRRKHFELMLETENLPLYELMQVAKFNGNHAGWLALPSIVQCIQICSKEAKVTFVDDHVEEYPCLFPLTNKMRDYLSHRPPHYAILHLYCVTNFQPPDLRSKEERKEVIDDMLQHDLHFMKQEQDEVHQLLADVTVTGADYSLENEQVYPGLLRLTVGFMARMHINFGVVGDLKQINKDKLQEHGRMVALIHREVEHFNIDAHVIQEVLAQYYAAMRNLEWVSSGLMRNVKDFMLRQPFAKVEDRIEDVMGRRVKFNSMYFWKYYSCHHVGRPNFTGYSEWGECDVLMVEFKAGGKVIADQNGWPLVANYEGDVQLFYELREFFMCFVKKPPDIVVMKVPVLVNALVVVWLLKALTHIKDIGYVWMIVLEGKLMTSHMVIRIMKREGGCSFERGLCVWKRYMIERTRFISRMFRSLDLYLENTIKEK